MINSVVEELTNYRDGVNNEFQHWYKTAARY